MSTAAQPTANPAVPNMAGKVMTVRGPIDPSQVGVTLMHEHVFIDLRGTLDPGFYTPATEVALWNEKLSLENLHQVVYPRRIGDNFMYADEKLAIAEAWDYRYAGGNTFVDVTSLGLRRDPLALRRVSHATGLNIVMGAGWYTKVHHPADMDQRTVEDLADEIIRDVTVGVGDTGIRSGIIGEVGVNGDPLTPNEIKSIRASARASRVTGAAISIHYGGVGEEKLRVLETIAGEGADLNRTIMGHSDSISGDMPLMTRLLERGAYIEFDLLAKLDVPLNYRPPASTFIYRGWSVTALVAEGVLNLLEAGYEDRILISHDVFPKAQFKSYGGTGWAFILEKFVPHLRSMGATEVQINKIMVENPKRLVTFAEPG